MTEFNITVVLAAGICPSSEGLDNIAIQTSLFHIDRAAVLVLVDFKVKKWGAKSEFPVSFLIASNRALRLVRTDEKCIDSITQ